MNTDAGMIDGEIVAVVMEKLNEGDTIRFYNDDDLIVERRLLEKGAFNLILQGLSSKLNISVTQTEEYRKRIAAMPRVAMPTEDVTAPRRGPGRPRKSDVAGTGPAAPVQHPGLVQHPPQGFTQAEAAGALGQSWQPPQQGQQPQQDRTEATPASDTHFWFTETLDKAVNQFRNELTDLLEAALERDEQSDASEPETAQVDTRLNLKPTCGDCVYSDMEKGICSKFNTTPPIFVVLDAQAKCDAFINSNVDESEIPF